MFAEDLRFEIQGDDGVLPWIGHKTGRQAAADFFREIPSADRACQIRSRGHPWQPKPAVIVGELATRIKSSGKIFSTQSPSSLDSGDKITRFQCSRIALTCHARCVGKVRQDGRTIRESGKTNHVEWHGAGAAAERTTSRCGDCRLPSSVSNTLGLNRWLGTSFSTQDMLAMADDAGVRITHFDPFVRWVDQWMPDLPGEDFPTDSIAYDCEDFFRMAAALKVQSFTLGADPGRAYETQQLIDAFGALCQRAEREGLRCDLEFIPVSESATSGRVADRRRRRRL